MTKDFIKGIPPGFRQSVVYKNAKKGTTSFRITQQLIQSIWYKAKKLKTSAVLILNIPANDKENYVLRCHIAKEKK